MILRNKIFENIGGFLIFLQIFISPIYPGSINIILMFLFIFLSLKRSEKIRFSRNRIILVLSLILLLSWSIFVSYSFVGTEVTLVGVYFLVGAFTIIYVYLINHNFLIGSLVAFTHQSIFFLLTILIFYFLGYLQSHSRLLGLGENPNYFSFALLFLFVIVFNLKQKINNLYYFYLFITLFSIVLTFSRGALLAVVISIFLFFISNLKFSYKISKKNTKTFVLIIGFTAIFTTTILLSPLFDILISRVDRVGSSDTNIRFIFWANAWELYINSPIINKLFGGLYHLLDNNTHNDVLRLLLSYGFVGCVLFYLSLLILYLKTPNTIIGNIGTMAIVVYSVASLTNDVYANKIPWIAIGFAIASVIVRDNTLKTLNYNFKHKESI